MGEFNSDDRYIYYCGQESLRRNGVAIIVNKRVWNAVLGYKLKNDRKISVCFQGKPFNITVIQVYTPTANAEETEDDWFYEDLQDFLELIPKKDIIFTIGDWNAKVRSQEIPGSGRGWITSVVSDSVRPHRRQPTRFLCPWDSPGKNTGVGCHFLFHLEKQANFALEYRMKQGKG